MKFGLTLLCLLSIITFTNHQDTDECWSLYNPSSKEQCTDINLSDSECCYVETNFNSNTRKECNPYNLDKINIDLYIKRILKKEKFSVINIYLRENDDNIDSIDDDTIISHLTELMKYTAKVECKSLTKTIDFSTVTYTKEDIEVAKKDNF